MIMRCNLLVQSPVSANCSLKLDTTDTTDTGNTGNTETTDTTGTTETNAMTTLKTILAKMKEVKCHVMSNIVLTLHYSAPIPADSAWYVAPPIFTR